MNYLGFLLVVIGLSLAFCSWTEVRRANRRDGGLLAAFGVGTLLLSLSVWSH